MAAYTTIDNPELYFQVKLWTGTGSTNALTFDGSEDMTPDLVWIKLRSGASDYGHRIFDSVRGVHKTLNSAAASTEGTETNSLTVFGSDGFTVVDADEVNQSGGSHTYVAWCWKAGGSGSANTAGSINTTKTSANTTSGISINLFSGTGSNATIGHGLGIAPTVIFCKNMASGSDNWNWNNFSVSDLGNTGRIYLNEADGNSAAAAAWNSTAPTSTLVSLGSNGENNGTTMILYAFAPIQGFSSFGSYSGNNADPDGTFVYLGFSPSVVVCRRIDSGDNWKVVTKKVEVHNPMNQSLKFDTAAAEGTESDHEIDLLSNGFKLRENNAAFNAAGTYTYMAWAEAPFVNSKGVPCNAQ